MTTQFSSALEPTDSEGVTERPLKDVFVLDSTVHAYNMSEENWVPGPYRERVSGQLAEMLISGLSLLPDGDPKWALSRERFMRGADPELLGDALFRESDTDMCI